MSQDFPFKDEDFTLTVNKSQAQSIFKMFQFGTSSNNKESDNKIQNEDEENKYLSYFSKFKEQVTQKTSSTISSITSKGQEAQNVAVNWQYFLIFLILGCIFISMALFYLPFIMIMPSKFASSLALGSLCIMIAMALIKGPYNFLTSLISKDKALFSFSYIITLMGTIYFSIISSNYFMVLIFTFSQIFSLMWLISSNFPGGTAGMKYISNQLFSCFKGCFGRLFQNKSSSFLPI